MPDKINGTQQTVYDKDYLKNIKPKDEQKTRSLFNRLWDETAKLIDSKADANGDGIVDKNDLPLLQQLITNLQKGQAIIEKNVKKFTFDPEKFKEGFQSCERNLKKVIEDITAGTYVSPEEKLEQYKKEQETKAAQSKETSSISEPDETDAESNRFDSPQQQITAYRAEKRLEKLAQDIASLKQDQNWQIQHGQPYFGLKPEDISEIAMQDIADIFLGKQPQEDDAKHLIHWATNMFYACKLDGKGKNTLVAKANEALNRIEQQRLQASNNDSEENSEVAQNNNDSIIEDIINQVHQNTPVGGNYGNNEIADDVIAQIHEETPVRTKRD